ncbi:enoyl ACP reductase FabMG family protein [Shimia aestuarii]|jgi:hypothetical protein|uniref:enoyl ACP reductase FabMG family protein n=1 Tax=Shimia aestuarii TaxID=254406 RepID=UPI001FB550EE|nr:hypothetical protein [Shimia aestuarii]
MVGPSSLTKIPDNTLFGEGDIFVLFGELFGRGYATGLVDAAKAAGMTILGVTVGRRDDDNRLRALTEEELSAAEANLGGRIINVPLIAGFDLDAPDGEPTPTDLLNEMTLDGWQNHNLDWDHVERCRQIGVARFTSAIGRVMEQLDGMIPDGRNVFFAHTMAGGIPRAKVFMAIANRIYKGRGARYMSSQTLIDSDLGKLILQNFDEVTAHSFGHLLDASGAIRQRIEATGGQVHYTAYGYHGTRVLIGDKYRWQTYTNYTQGYAKMRLESIARAAWDEGIKATVFNCPEIRTNSSDVFAGIELSLLPLLSALLSEGGGAVAERLWQQCQDLLQEGVSLEDILKIVTDYQKDPVMEPFYSFEAWPMANTGEQVEKTVGTSQKIVALHSDRKLLISDLLSQHVVTATGKLIFDEACDPTGPVLWLDHDLVAQKMICA